MLEDKNGVSNAEHCRLYGKSSVYAEIGKNAQRHVDDGVDHGVAHRDDPLAVREHLFQVAEQREVAGRVDAVVGHGKAVHQRGEQRVQSKDQNTQGHRGHKHKAGPVFLEEPGDFSPLFGLRGKAGGRCQLGLFHRRSGAVISGRLRGKQQWPPPASGCC